MEGARTPLPASTGLADATLRLVALLPLLLVQAGRRTCPLVWGLVGAVAWLGGALSAGSPDSGPAAAAARPWTPSHWAEASGVVAGRVLADPRERGDRWSAPVAGLAWSPDGGDAPRPPHALFRGRGAAPPRGAVVVARAGIRPAQRGGTPGGFDERRWLRGRGLTRVAWVDTLGMMGPPDLAARVGAALGRARAGIAERLERVLPPPEAPVARAVLLGLGLPDNLRAAFAGLGLAHLFALSGLHVGIIAGLGLLALRILPLPAARRGILLIPALVVYALLVDLPGSVVRAVGLVSLVLLGPLAGRRVDTLRVLGLVFWANVLWRPGCVLDVGVQLSYLAAGGIVAGQRVLAGRTGSRLGGALAVPVCAQLATLPVVARTFGVLPVWGPLVNLVVVPVFGAIVAMLAAGLMLATVWPWAGEGLLAVAAVGVRLVVATAAALVETEGGRTVGLADWGTARVTTHLVLVVALVLVLRRPGRRALVAGAAVYAGLLVAATWPSSPVGSVSVWQLDVGQGDCALVEFADGWRAVIDTGPAWYGGGGPLERDVWPWLRRRGIGSLDAVVLTHGHGDHTGGAGALADRVAVTRWLVAGQARAPAGAVEVRPTAGDTLHASGGWALVCLHPGADPGGVSGENDHSLTVGLIGDGRLRGLWSGDLEAAGETLLLPRCPPVPPEGLDVWKAGHHGSATSGSTPLLETLRPRLVVISTGVANRHRHPSHGPYVASGDTLPILRTDLHGAVGLHWTGRGLEVQPLRPP